MLCWLGSEVVLQPKVRRPCGQLLSRGVFWIMPSCYPATTFRLRVPGVQIISRPCAGGRRDAAGGLLGCSSLVRARYCTDRLFASATTETAAAASQQRGRGGRRRRVQ